MTPAAPATPWRNGPKVEGGADGFNCGVEDHSFESVEEGAQGCNECKESGVFRARRWASVNGTAVREVDMRSVLKGERNELIGLIRDASSLRHLHAIAE